MSAIDADAKYRVTATMDAVRQSGVRTWSEPRLFARWIDAARPMATWSTGQPHARREIPAPARSRADIHYAAHDLAPAIARYPMWSAADRNSWPIALEFEIAKPKTRSTRLLLTDRCSRRRPPVRQARRPPPALRANYSLPETVVCSKPAADSRLNTTSAAPIRLFRGAIQVKPAVPAVCPKPRQDRGLVFAQHVSPFAREEPTMRRACGKPRPSNEGPSVNFLWHVAAGFFGRAFDYETSFDRMMFAAKIAGVVSADRTSGTAACPEAGAAMDEAARRRV